MEPGVVKIAEDSDFDMLKSLVDSDTDWKLEYDKGGGTKVSFSTFIPYVVFAVFSVQCFWRRSNLLHCCLVARVFIP